MRYDDWYIHEEWAFLDDIIDFYLRVDLDFYKYLEYDCDDIRIQKLEMEYEDCCWYD